MTAATFVASIVTNGLAVSPAAASHPCLGGGVDIDGVTSTACGHTSTPGTPGGPSGSGDGQGNPNGGTVTVSSPPPDCRFFPDKTGPEMAALIGFIGPVMPPFPPAAQMQA